MLDNSIRTCYNVLAGKGCTVMSMSDKIQFFEDKRIRTAWDEEAEEWYFSVVDVVGVLTEQETQRGAST